MNHDQLQMACYWIRCHSCDVFDDDGFDERNQMTKPKRGDKVRVWDDDKSLSDEEIFLDDVSDISPNAEHPYIAIDIDGFPDCYKNVELIEDEIKLWDVVEGLNIIGVVVEKIDLETIRIFNPNNGGVYPLRNDSIKLRKDLVARAPVYFKKQKCISDYYYSKKEFDENELKKAVWPSRNIDFRIDEVNE